MTDLTYVNKKINTVWKDWQATELIGAGTFGEVYRAVCTDAPDCVAAIKIITIPKNEEEICLLRSDEALFRRESGKCAAAADAISKELAAQASLSREPNILAPQAYSVRLSDNGCSYDVLIRTDLLTPITSMPQIGEQEAVKLGIDVCIALEACAKLGTVHRDIKPSNIYCTDFGTYKVGDLGITRVLEGVTGDLTMYSGTPKFMAPEAVMGIDFDARADIYSLGMVLYHIMNGGIPPFYPADGSSFTVEDADEADLKRIRGDVIPPAVGASDELMAVLYKACAADPADRYADASEMKQALVNVYTSILFGRATENKPTEIKWDTTTLFDMPAAVRAESATATAIAVKDAVSDGLDTVITDGEVSQTAPLPKAMREAGKVKKKSRLPLILIIILFALLFAVGAVIAVRALIGIVSDFSGKNTDDTSITTEALPDESPVALLISKMPDSFEFAVGEPLTFEGLELDAVYADGTSVTVKDGFTVTPAKLLAAGEHTVRVHVGEAYVELHVTAVPAEQDTDEITEHAKVKSLVMKTLPAKLDYYVGQSLDPEGMRLDVTYDSGIMATVSEGFTVSPEVFTKEGETTVTVSLGGKEITFDVTVEPAVFTRIAVRTAPSKTVYYAGEALVTDGLTIYEVYTDGSFKKVTSGFTVSPTVLGKEGEQYITVSYRGKTTGFKVTVNGVALTSISVATPPSKLEYVVGERINLSGLTLNALYSNGVTEKVSGDYVGMTPNTATAVGVQAITVSYGGKTASFNVTVKDPISANGTCGKDLAWSLKGGVLYITGSGEMNDYSAGSAPWSKYASYINSVSISDEVTSIGDYAFSYLPITGLSLSQNVKDISDTAVFMCTSLKVISVSTNNRYYQTRDGVLYSKDMTKLYIYPTGKQESIFTLPTTVTTIAGYQVFRGAVFKEIVLTDSVYSIDKTAFYLAPNIEKVSVRTKNTALASVDGVLFNKSMNELIYFPVNKKTTDYTVPETVRYIRDYAFTDNTAISAIAFPAGLRSVGTNAFAGCNSLKSVSYAGSEREWESVSFGDGNGILTHADIDFGE